MRRMAGLNVSEPVALTWWVVAGVASRLAAPATPVTPTLNRRTADRAR
jgi:uncharacterized membrane protein